MTNHRTGWLPRRSGRGSRLNVCFEGQYRRPLLALWRLPTMTAVAMPHDSFNLDRYASSNSCAGLIRRASARAIKVSKLGFSSPRSTPATKRIDRSASFASVCCDQPSTFRNFNMFLPRCAFQSMGYGSSELSNYERCYAASSMLLHDRIKLRYVIERFDHRSGPGAQIISQVRHSNQKQWR